MPRSFKLSLLLIILLTSPATALEKIEGAFGLKFGEIYTKKSLHKSNDKNVFTFLPQNPLKYFIAYAVRLTPTTRKIVGMTAFSGKIEKSLCTDYLNTLKDILIKKYGTEKEKSIEQEVWEITTISQARRGIIIQCKGFGTKRSLQLSYVDNNMRDLGEKERIEIAKTQINKNGL